VLNQILGLLLDTFFGLFVFVLLARFYMQVFRASFRNPIGGFVLALSNWAVLPARKIIPPLFGLDMATLVVAWLAEAILLFLLLTISNSGYIGAPEIAIGLILVAALLELIRTSIYLLMGVVILQALLSWVNPNTPLAPMLNTLTRPFYRVFQRLIPPIGGIDLSPLFLLILLQILLILLAAGQGVLKHML
jgi:YggT family protein